MVDGQTDWRTHGQTPDKWAYFCTIHRQKYAIKRVPNWHTIRPSKVTSTCLGAGFSNWLSSWAVYQQWCQHNCGWFQCRTRNGKILDNTGPQFRSVYLPCFYHGRDIMPLCTATKFHEDLAKTLWLREQTSLFGKILDNSREVIQECMGQYSWLSTFGELLCL